MTNQQEPLKPLRLPQHLPLLVLKLVGPHEALEVDSEADLDRLRPTQVRSKGSPRRPASAGWELGSDLPPAIICSDDPGCTLLIARSASLEVSPSPLFIPCNDELLH